MDLVWFPGTDLPGYSNPYTGLRIAPDHPFFPHSPHHIGKSNPRTTNRDFEDVEIGSCH